MMCDEQGDESKEPQTRNMLGANKTSTPLTQDATSRTNLGFGSFKSLPIKIIDKTNSATTKASSEMTPGLPM